MANTPAKSLRVRPGSALERLTVGGDFTDRVHKIAEVLELAMAEEAAKAAAQPQIEIGPRLTSRGTIEVGPHLNGVAIEMVDELPAVVLPPEGQALPAGASDAMVLAAMAEQVPAGLVPVAVLHGTEDDDLAPSPQGVNELEEDLSDLA